MTVPLYSYNSAFLGEAPERIVLRLERDGLAKLIRNRTGQIARAVMFKRPGDPAATTLRDYMGRGYSCKHYLDDGHRPWALRPLAGRIYRGDQSVEYHLAPASMRPIFMRVLLDCMTPAM